MVPICRTRTWGLVRSISTSAGKAGLFGLKSLDSAQDWSILAKQAIDRCEDIVQDVTVGPPSIDTIRYLDNISDTVCQVYDAAEFCWNVHADAAWRNAATEACSTLGAYVQQLNMHSGLHSKLVQTLDMYERARALAVAQGRPPEDDLRAFTPEAVLVGKLLRRDFEKQGVHLEAHQQEELADLTSHAQSLGMRFGQNLTDETRFKEVCVPAEKVSHLGNAAFFLGWSGQGPLHLNTHPSSFSTLLHHMPDEDLRRQVYIAGNTSPAANLGCLEELIQTRQRIGQLLGAKSYAHYVADGATLARRPEAVHRFLAALSQANKPHAEEEVEQLRRLKARQQGKSLATTQLEAWDRSFYMQMAREEEAGAHVTDGSNMYSLSSCLQGINTVLQQVMDLSLTSVPLEPGEGWAPGLSKMAVEQQGHGLLGHIFLDLHPRPGKFPHAAHFTLRCGRRLAGGNYQTPLVALVFNFEGGPHALLNQSRVETLWHEFGHALNSLLSRTEYQHLAGTRGSLDTVEIASHVMELFAVDPRTAAALLKPQLAKEGAAELHKALSRITSSRSSFRALKLEQRIIDSMVDQALHGIDPPGKGQSVQCVAEVIGRMSATPVVPSTAPHIRFGHLVGYGGAYYSYLYAETIAAAIWDRLFREDPWSRDAGEVIRSNLLEVGGAKEPLEFVEDILGRGYIQPVDGGFMPPPSIPLA